MRQRNDLSRSLVALDQDSTIIAVIEMGQASWLVAGIVPGVNRNSLKKIATDQEQLLQVLRRWAKEADTTGRMIKRVAVVYEAGRNGFWLARWLRARGVEAYVIHPSSVPVSREHRRARLGIREFKPMLRSAPQLLETLRTPEDAALPPNTLAELRRDMVRLSFVKQQINVKGPALNDCSRHPENEAMR